MSQTENNPLGDMLDGLNQLIGGVDSTIAKIKQQVTPEVLDSLPAEKKHELQGLLKELDNQYVKVQPQANEAMAAATELLRKAGMA